MKVLCTKTGPCDHFAPFTDDVPWCKAKGGSNCPYYTRTGLAEVIEYGPQSTGDVALMQEWGKAAAEAASYRLLCDALLEEYEELAGENRRLRAAFDDAVDTYVGQTMGECPGPGWYWVRGHWRSRAQNSAAIDPDQGTVQAAPGEGQTGASGEATGHSPEGADPQIRDAYCRGRSGIPLGNWCNESQSGDATGADKEQPCPGCGSYRGTHGLGCRILALTQSGEERSE